MSVVNVEGLFKDGDRRYAVYTGQDEGKAVLSGAKNIVTVELSVVAKLKEGARVYFNEKGEVLEAKAADVPTERTTTRNTGSNTRMTGKDQFVLA